MTRPNAKTIAFDFDGVLHRYSKGWADGTIYDPPVDGAQQAVRTLLESYDLIIYTCRVNHDNSEEWTEETPKDRELAIRTWLVENDFPNDWAWAVKIYPKPTAWLYVDDRGWRFEGPHSWGNLVRLLP